MNKIILNSDNYSFNSTLGQITIDSSITVTKEFLLIITNVTTNTIVYNFACDGFGGTIVDNVLSLEYDTASMSDTDDLQIILYTAINAELDAQTILLQILSNNTRELNKIKELIKETNKLLQKIYKPY